MNTTIALLTDFGTKDYFVGAMKGVILSINNSAGIVDITHEIPPQEIRGAGFTLDACYRDFPRKTIFAAVVDPGVGSNRRAVLCETKDYFFIAPDNGLLSFIFNSVIDFQVYELTNEKFFKHPVSRTFHGRDIFAPVAAHLSNGIKAGEFGREIRDFMRFEESKPRQISPDKIEGEIIHIDRFGNLITNLRQSDLPGTFTLQINRKKIGKMQNFFAQAENGELFSIIGSAGFLEIAAFQDSAELLLSAKLGQKITVKLNAETRA